jgi:hypothetical protein
MNKSIPTPAEVNQTPAIVADDDNFDPPADSPLWDEWAADAAASDAVCSGAVL